MICFGHRGARGHAPENTLGGVRRGLELGADWIEIDVRLVHDRLLVIHDDSVDRTTNGEGVLELLELDHIRTLDVGEGEQIPFLEEVFEVLGDEAGLNIELKGVGAADGVVDLIQQQVADGLSRERILVSCFDHRQLVRVHELDRKIALGALFVGLPLTNAALAETVGAFSVHPSVDFIDEAFVEDAHLRGLKVFPFTVNRERDITRLAELGVDGVFTDYPERVVGG